MGSILYNGRIVTCDDDDHVYEAIEIKDGRIAALGSNEELLAGGRIAGLELIDLKGRTVIPGIIESHTHFSDAALSELDGELFIPGSVKELLEYVKERVKTLPAGEWLYFRNTYPTRLEEYRFPTIRELDAAAPQNPVYVSGWYAGQVNSCALETAGIGEDTAPAGGKLCRDRHTGRLNGTLFMCAHLLRNYLKTRQYSEDETIRAMVTLQKEYSRLGITSIVDGGTSPAAVEACNRLYSKGELNIRAVYTCFEEDFEKTGGRIESMAALVKTPPQWGKLGFLKTTADGGILTGTSYMRKPYGEGCRVFGIDDNEFRGVLMTTSEQLAAYIRKASGANLQMSAHCVGDAALDVFLRAYEEADGDTPVRGGRHSVIHADFTDADTLRRCKDLGLTLFSQPAWHYMDGSILNSVLDGETMHSFLPYRDMEEIGVHVCAGSDHMVKHDSFRSVNPYNPFLGMYSLVTRKTCKGDAIYPEQRVTRLRALKMYTIEGAYATFDEKEKGSLEKGKLADLAVLDRDYLSCPEEDIPSIQSVLTIVGGRVAFKDKMM